MLIFFSVNEKNDIIPKYPDKEVPMPNSVPMIRMSDVQQTAVHWLWYVALLLYCPARSEDIRGIRMKDIDPHKMLIRIERSVTYAKAKTIIGDPKTEAGFRHMLMLPKLWDVLALTSEEMHDPDAYLLHMRDDTHQPLTFQANRRLWERVCAAINVYGKTPHCFRHTFATRAYRAGVSEKTLQSMGGWADLKTMQNVYIHTQEEDLENARRLLTLL